MSSCRWGPHDGTNALIKRGEDMGSLSVCVHHGRTCENGNRKKTPSKSPAMLAPWSQTSSLRTVRNKPLLVKPLSVWNSVIAAQSE